MSFPFAILCSAYCIYASYDVKVVHIDSNPVASYVNHNSNFQQVYNPALVISSPSVNTPGLVIRTENCTLPANGSCNHSSQCTPSIMTFVTCDWVNGTCSNSKTNPINQTEIMFAPDGDSIDSLGTEDPRIKYNKYDGFYYLFYTSYGYNSNGTRKVLLSLAKSKYPYQNGSWIRYGPIFNQSVSPSKSGALLIPDTSEKDPFNYLYWFGSPCIYLAISANITKWDSIGKTFICPRENGFDSLLTESGPPPIKLFDNNYIFLYNSANKGWPHQLNTSYNVGFVIIDGQNKSLILQRSPLNTPVLSPTFPWEIGQYPYTCNHPNVVFVEGAVKLNQQQKMKYIAQNPKLMIGKKKNFAEIDLIRVYFGGSDAVTGTAVLSVEKTSN